MFMNELFVSLAYKYVFLTLMLAEANHAIDQCNVSTWRAITMAEVTTYYITPPRIWPGGSLETTNFFFGFREDGRLHYIHYSRYPKYPAVSLRDRYKEWAKMQSLIGTNEAYQLATNWLNRLELNVAMLEKVHPPHVLQAYYDAAEDDSAGRINGKDIILVPRFEVTWGTNADPVVWVSIFGPAKEPIQIRIEDESFLKRPRGLIKDPERLLAIPDKEFGAYGVAQKSNLVVECATARYSNIFLPDVVLKRSLQSPTNNLGTNGRSPERLKSQKGELRTLPPK